MKFKLTTVKIVPQLVVIVCSLAAVGITRGAVAQSQSGCLVVAQSEADAVFNQALRTISTLADAAVKAAQRRTWKPDGTFKKRFFSRAGTSLRTIRTLLTSSATSAAQCPASASSICTQSEVPKAALLQAFDEIFSISFPKGLASLRRLKQVEREKFSQAVEALPDNYTTCQ